MIIGAHAIVYSKDSDADRAFFRDVLDFPHVDAGGGWLIFGLPPSEVAVHPAEGNGMHELYLMTDDVEAFVADMQKRGVTCEPLSNQRWGILTSVRLPGGGSLGVYQPLHASPPQVQAKKKAAPKTKAKAKAKPKAKPAAKAKAKPKAKAKGKGRR